MSEPYVIGIDLGGTKVEACLMDSEKKVIARHRTPSEANLGLQRVIRNIETVVKKAADGKPFQAIGMGTPGTYVPKENKLYGSPHTPIYEQPHFIGRIRDTFGVPFEVENDANCLALAEYVATCLNKYNYVMSVIIGTGIGFGLICDGKLYRGPNGAAGEIGHMTVNMDGRPCQCGRRGCAEAYLSGPSLTRRFFEMSGKEMEPVDIYTLYEKKDPQAEALFEESCHIMGEVFANVITALDLEAIILGGGVSNLPIWYEKVPAYIRASLFGVPRSEIPLIKSEMGDSAGVVGAAYLALRSLGKMDF